jgi:hypothetical protein
VLCGLAGRFAAVRGWERLGYARLGDYATERLGVAPRSLRDWAHVDGALRELPGVEAALVSGALGWTKVRLLARVATPTDERQWLSVAHRLSARALAGEVRAIDLGDRGPPGNAPESSDEDLEGSEEGPRAQVVVRASPETRARWRHCHLLARQVSGDAVPMWQAMEWVAAEVLSALPLERRDLPGASPDAAQREQPAPRGSEPRNASPASLPAPEVVELPPALAVLLEGLETADAFELHRRLEGAVALEQRLEAEVAPVLLQVFEGRLFRRVRDGYTRFDDYAADRLGFSARRARMLLRVARAARSCPALASAWRTGQLSWMKVHELVAVVVLADAGHARAWIEWAARVTVRRLRNDVARAIDLAATDPAGSAATGGLPEETGERQTGADCTASAVAPRAECFFFSAPIVVAQLFKAAVCRVRRYLERGCGQPAGEDDAVRCMFEHFQEVWDQTSVPRRYAVFARDGWRCTVPGCSSYRNLQDHHIVYRSRGGSDALSNRTTLCAWHHLRGQHAGRIRVVGTAPDGLEFELGLRDAQPSLARYDACERLLQPTRQTARSTTMAL